MSNLGKNEGNKSDLVYYGTVEGAKPQIFSNSKIVLEDAPVNRQVVAMNEASINRVKLALSKENFDQNGIKVSPHNVASSGRSGELNV